MSTVLGAYQGMKKSEYEIVSNQISHIKTTTEGAIRALELNLKYLSTIEDLLRTSMDKQAPDAAFVQLSLSHLDTGKQPSDLIKIKEVTQMTSLSRSTIYSKMSRQEFPQSRSLSCRSVSWIRKEIENWIQSKMQERIRE